MEGEVDGFCEGLEEGEVDGVCEGLTMYVCCPGISQCKIPCFQIILSEITYQRESKKEQKKARQRVSSKVDRKAKQMGYVRV